MDFILLEGRVDSCAEKAPVGVFLKDGGNFGDTLFGLDYDIRIMSFGLYVLLEGVGRGECFSGYYSYYLHWLHVN